MTIPFLIICAAIIITNITLILQRRRINKLEEKMFTVPSKTVQSKCDSYHAEELSPDTMPSKRLIGTGNRYKYNGVPTMEMFYEAMIDIKNDPSIKGIKEAKFYITSEEAIYKPVLWALQKHFKEAANYAMGIGIIFEKVPNYTYIGPVGDSDYISHRLTTGEDYSPVISFLIFK